MARKPDPSAIAYNPALIARLPGVHLMAGASAIMPSGKMDYVDNGVPGTTTLKPGTWVVPHLYYTHQLSDSFTLGVGEFSRYGLGFEYPNHWPGRFNIYRVDLASISVNPVIAWAVTEDFSLAAGIEFVYVNLDLQKRVGIETGFGLAEIDSNIQNASDTSVGFNLAAHYQLCDELALGFQYRSRVRVHAYGDVEFSYLSGPSLPGIEAAVMSNFRNGGADSVVTLPDSFAGGIAFMPIPELSIEAGAIYTRWSSFKELNINLPAPLPNSVSDRSWKDVWRFNVGVEYEPLDWLALRAGYVYDESPMPGSKEDYLVPTDGRHIFSLGTGFKYEDWTLDLAYAYIKPLDRKYQLDPRPTEQGGSHVVHSRTRDSDTNIFSFSLGYKF